MNKPLKTLGITAAGVFAGVAVAYAISPDKSHDAMIHATYAGGFLGAGGAHLVYYFGPHIWRHFRKDGKGKGIDDYPKH